MTTDNHPKVHWQQSNEEISLEVDIDNPENIKVQLQKNLLSLSIENDDLDSSGKVILLLEFHRSINTKKSSHYVSDKKLKIILKKTDNSEWKRLSSYPSDPLWVSNGTEKSQSENVKYEKPQASENFDNKANIHAEELEVRDIHQDYPHMYDELHKEELGYKKEDLKEVYLVLYNLCQFIGFMYIFIVLSIRYIREGPNYMQNTYDSVGNVMKFIQLLQFLEVMHPMFGYTRGNAFIALIQVGGRAFILFSMIEAEPRMQTKPVVFYLFYVWSCIEIFRYPYYITQLLNVSIPLLTWLRYTIWIPLYPLGFLCEGTIVLRNIPYFEETNKFTVSLPNSWNFGFHFSSVLRIYLLLLCIPGVYTMMSHMYQMRKKKLSKSKVN